MLLLGKYAPDAVTNDTIDDIIAERPTDSARTVWDEVWTPQRERTPETEAADDDDAAAEAKVIRSCWASNLKLAPQTRVPEMKQTTLIDEGLFGKDGWPARQDDFFGFGVEFLRSDLKVSSLAAFVPEVMHKVEIAIPYNPELKTIHGRSWQAFTDAGVPYNVNVPNLHHVAKAVNDLSVQSLSIASTLGVFAHTLVPFALYAPRYDGVLSSQERGRLRANFPHQLKSLQEMWTQTSRIPIARHHCDAVVKCILAVTGTDGIKVWGGLSPSTLPVPFIRVKSSRKKDEYAPVGAVPDVLLYDQSKQVIYSIEIKTKYGDKERQRRAEREQLRQSAMQALAVSFAITQNIAVIPMLVHVAAGADIVDGHTAVVHIGNKIPSLRSPEACNILADCIQFSKCAISSAAGGVITFENDSPPRSRSRMVARLRTQKPLIKAAAHIAQAMM